jgi:hypothetical protein
MAGRQKNDANFNGAFKPMESDFNVKVIGGGSADQYGKGLGGRVSATKKLAKDLELEGYLEGFAAKPKGGSSMAELTGGGVKLTKRFAKGGWIKDAIKKPGALRKSLGVKVGEKVPAGKLAAAAKKPGKMGQRARLAQTLKGLKK